LLTKPNNQKEDHAIMTSNADYVRTLYAAFGRGDLKFVLENCDPAIDWVSNGAVEDIRWGGTRKGISGAQSFFHLLTEYLDFEAFER
jgi:uncharacterized protein